MAVELTEKLKMLFLGKSLPGNIDFRDITTEYGVVNEGESSGSWYESRLLITVEYRWFL